MATKTSTFKLSGTKLNAEMAEKACLSLDYPNIANGLDDIAEGQKSPGVNWMLMEIRTNII